MSSQLILLLKVSWYHEEVHRHLLLQEISNHRNISEYVSTQESTFEYKGKRHQIQTNKGWEFYVTWKDGSTNWISLKELKEYSPMELARYVDEQRQIGEAAFIWWVKDVIKKSH